MAKPNCHAKAELKKGPWTREEDHKLLAYIEQHGHGSWRSLPAKAGLQRCGKSCRLRWTNYLRPDIKRGKFSTHEEKAIIRLHALLGNRWSAIAAYLPKRTDNEIKNYWNTRLKKRLTRMGIDPVTHKPKNNAGGSRRAADLSHMAQWETARLEAEARLARESKAVPNLHSFQRFAAARHRPPPLLPAVAPCLDVLKVCQATSNRFFSSAAAGSLDSPTSTLSFSGHVRTVPPSGGSVAGNDVVSATDYGSAGTGVEENYVNSYGEVEGKMENIPLMQLHGDLHSLADYHVPDYDYDIVTSGAVDPAAASRDSEGHNSSFNALSVGEFEDAKNYWNELLCFVSSPMENMGS